MESKFGREGLEKRLLHVDFAHHLVGVVADVQELDDLGGLALARELVRGILQVPEVLRGGFLRGEWIWKYRGKRRARGETTGEAGRRTPRSRNDKARRD